MTTVTEETEPEVEVDAAAILREQVEARQGPANRTIIMFEYAYDTEPKEKKRTYYTFVSVWIADKGRWFSSGVGQGVPREASHEDLMRVLASNHVKSASVATSFDRFKP